LRFHLVLFFVSLALVGFAVWFALRFADRQVQPLTDLVAAARRVGSGNFSLRVAGRTGADEIGMLNRAFNRMTAQIEQQTSALVNANRQAGERRTFIEAVLESISAGIVSVNAGGSVLLMNSSAQKLLLDTNAPSPVGSNLADLAPQLAAMIDARLADGLVQYNKQGDLLTLAVKIAPATSGHVITFEDITRQLLDQRQAAWSDVARRIAHEIKNPLTPIQLATERLSRRYRKQILADGELFDELTSTIIRQVGELRKMVDEFSSFARLPKPAFRSEDAVDLVRQAVFLQEVARPDIHFGVILEGDVPPTIACDRHQFGQTMTNVLKNAVEAIEARAGDAEPDCRGRIEVSISADPHMFTVSIADNGIGLPKERERITEPYMTTREKGTGLGLAIVNKIIEEHGGEMTFAPVPVGAGTVVTLRFARDPLARQETGT
jgi:two-component system nitrogen regulation sensor histidine kinase NtrY